MCHLFCTVKMCHLLYRYNTASIGQMCHLLYCQTMPSILLSKWAIHCTVKLCHLLLRDMGMLWSFLFTASFISFNTSTCLHISTDHSQNNTLIVPSIVLLKSSMLWSKCTIYCTLHSAAMWFSNPQGEPSGVWTGHKNPEKKNEHWRVPCVFLVKLSQWCNMHF